MISRRAEAEPKMAGNGKEMNLAEALKYQQELVLRAIAAAGRDKQP